MQNLEPSSRSVVVQTTLRVTETEDNDLIVVSDRGCQTVTTFLPDVLNENIVPLLEFTPYSEIVVNSLKIYDLPRKYQLQFDLSGAPAIRSRNTSISDGNYKSVLKKTGSDNIDDSEVENEESEEFLHLNPDLALQLEAMRKPKTDEDCQTDLTVTPPVLDDDAIASVCTQLGVQTSLTFNPNDSLSKVTPELKKYMRHTEHFQSVIVDGKIITDYIDPTLSKEDLEVSNEKVTYPAKETTSAAISTQESEEETKVEDGTKIDYTSTDASKTPFSQPITISDKTNPFYQLNMTEEEFEKNVQKILDKTVENVYEFMGKIVDMYEKSKQPKPAIGNAQRRPNTPLDERDIQDRAMAFDYLEQIKRGLISPSKIEVLDNLDGSRSYKVKETDGEVEILNDYTINTLQHLSKDTEEEQDVTTEITDESEIEKIENGIHTPPSEPTDIDREYVFRILERIHAGLMPPGRYSVRNNSDGTKTYLVDNKDRKIEILEVADIYPQGGWPRIQTVNDEKVHAGKLSTVQEVTDKSSSEDNPVDTTYPTTDLPSDSQPIQETAEMPIGASTEMMTKKTSEEKSLKEQISKEEPTPLDEKEGKQEEVVQKELLEEKPPEGAQQQESSQEKAQQKELPQEETPPELPPPDDTQQQEPLQEEVQQQQPLQGGGQLQKPIPESPPSPTEIVGDSSIASKQQDIPCECCVVRDHGAAPPALTSERLPQRSDKTITLQFSLPGGSTLEKVGDGFKVQANIAGSGKSDTCTEQTIIVSVNVGGSTEDNGCNCAEDRIQEITTDSCSCSPLSTELNSSAVNADPSPENQEVRKACLCKNEKLDAQKKPRPKADDKSYDSDSIVKSITCQTDEEVVLDESCSCEDTRHDPPTWSDSSESKTDEKKEKKDESKDKSENISMQSTRSKEKKHGFSCANLYHGKRKEENVIPCEDCFKKQQLEQTSNRMLAKLKGRKDALSPIGDGCMCRYSTAQKSYSCNCMAHKDIETVETEIVTSAVDVVSTARLCGCRVQNVIEQLKQKTSDVVDSKLIEKHMQQLQPLLQHFSGANTTCFKLSAQKMQKCACVSSVQVIYKKTEEVIPTKEPKKKTAEKACACDMKPKTAPLPKPPKKVAKPCHCKGNESLDVTPHGAPLYQDDDEYAETYYNELVDEQHLPERNVDRGSLPEVVTETDKCGKRTELPWLRIALPPSGSYDIQKMPKKICGCQKKKLSAQEHESILPKPHHKPCPCKQPQKKPIIETPKESPKESTKSEEAVCPAPCSKAFREKVTPVHVPILPKEIAGESNISSTLQTEEIPETVPQGQAATIVESGPEDIAKSMRPDELLQTPQASDRVEPIRRGTLEFKPSLQLLPADSPEADKSELKSTRNVQKIENEPKSIRNVKTIDQITSNEILEQPDHPSILNDFTYDSGTLTPKHLKTDADDTLPTMEVKDSRLKNLDVSVDDAPISAVLAPTALNSTLPVPIHPISTVPGTTAPTSDTEDHGRRDFASVAKDVVQTNRVISAFQDKPAVKKADQSIHPDCICVKPSMKRKEKDECSSDELKKLPVTKQVYDDQTTSYDEEYMAPLSKMFPDEIESPCGENTEIDWDEILIPKKVKLKSSGKGKGKECPKVCSEISEKPSSAYKPTHLVTKHVATVDDAKPAQVTPKGAGSFIELELRFSGYAEITSTLLPVEGGASSQKTVSNVSTISDVRMKLKRVPEDYVVTMITADGQKLSNFGQMPTVGSQPFIVTNDQTPSGAFKITVAPPQTDSTPFIPDKVSDFMNMLNYENLPQPPLTMQIQTKVDHESIPDHSHCQFEICKLLRGEDECECHKDKPAESVGTSTSSKFNKSNKVPDHQSTVFVPSTGVPTDYDYAMIAKLADINLALTEKHLGAAPKPHPKIRRDASEQQCRCPPQPSTNTIFESSAPKPSIFPSGYAAVNPLIMAIQTCEKEMQPLKQSLNELINKVQSMNIPELDNWSTRTSCSSCCMEGKELRHINFFFPCATTPFQRNAQPQLMQKQRVENTPQQGIQNNWCRKDPPCIDWNELTTPKSSNKDERNMASHRNRDRSITTGRQPPCIDWDEPTTSDTVTKYGRLRKETKDIIDHSMGLDGSEGQERPKRNANVFEPIKVEPIIIADMHLRGRTKEVVDRSMGLDTLHPPRIKLGKRKSKGKGKKKPSSKQTRSTQSAASLSFCGLNEQLSSDTITCIQECRNKPVVINLRLDSKHSLSASSGDQAASSDEQRPAKAVDVSPQSVYPNLPMNYMDHNFQNYYMYNPYMYTYGQSPYYQDYSQYYYPYQQSEFTRNDADAYLSENKNVFPSTSSHTSRRSTSTKSCTSATCSTFSRASAPTNSETKKISSRFCNSDYPTTKAFDDSTDYVDSLSEDDGPDIKVSLTKNGPVLKTKHSFKGHITKRGDRIVRISLTTTESGNRILSKEELADSSTTTSNY